MNFAEYFQASDNYFWQWEENTNVIAIPKGNTIAYRDFVIDMIEKLRPQGIPPFGSLLLAIIATNPTAKDDFETIDRNFETFFEQTHANNTVFIGKKTRETTWKFLNILAELPQQYKHGARRILLFMTLFSDCHKRISTKKTMQILTSFEQSKDDLASALIPQAFNDRIFYKDFRVFEFLLKKFPSVEAIIEAIANLPSIEEEIALPLPESPPKETHIVDLLIDNAKTFYIGRLIPRLWSGLNMNFQRHAPSDQTLGGIADLTNKGNLDQLLVSEYAYDEWTFLSRLANNESLFLKKEAPPSNNRLERVILVDQSIKNWGTPRTIAYALMLAIAQHPKAETNCLAFSLGQAATPIYFDTLEQIIDSMDAIEASLTCLNGLNDFLTNYPLNAASEVIFIGHKEALMDTNIQQLMQIHASKISYWIHPFAHGQIDIYRQSNQHKKLTQSFTLPLEQLWKKPQKVTAAEVLELNDFEGSFPILFPQAISYKKALCTSNEELFIVTKEKSFMYQIPRNNSLGKGWQMLCESLPAGNGLYDIGLHDSGNHLLLVFDLGYKVGTIINLHNQEKKSFKFNKYKAGRFKDFCFYDNAFCFATYTGYWRIEWGNEQAVFIEKIPPELLDAFKERSERLQALTKNLTVANNILKNIQHIALNEDGELVVNRLHELSINHEGAIKFYKNAEGLNINSTKVSKHEFAFPDGSKIYTNRSGVMKLVSANQDIPTIYIPLTIDAPLGMATESFFAGNKYYLEPSYNLTVIQTKDFWLQYLSPFINHITQHGT